MFIRSYQPDDRTPLLEVLDRLIPEFFVPEERADFEQYLLNEREDYFVVEVDQRVVAGGGINYFPAERTARLSWDLVDPAFHGRQIGSALVQHRLAVVRSNQLVDTVIVRTSQLAESFYQKQGFQRIHFQADFWGKGFDLVVMEWIHR